MSGQSFIGGAFLLAFSNLTVKILGSIFRIPLGNMIGSDGMGYYQTAYPIYTSIIAVSTSGLPVAISKMVSERTKLGDLKSARKVLNLSAIMMLAIGIATSSLFYFGSEEISLFVGDINAAPSIKALALALLIVPVVSAFKGYFQGRSDMIPTSIAQFFEQLGRVIVGLFLAYMFLDKSLVMAAAGASFGASAGAIASLVVIIIIYIISLPKLNREIEETDGNTDEKSGQIIRQMMILAVPIIIGSLATSLVGIIDVSLIKKRLMEGGLIYEVANSLYGQYSGMVATIVNLPQALTMSIGTTIVPLISSAFITRDFVKIRKSVNLGARLSNLISMPCMVGIIVLATPIMNLLYPSEPDSVGQMLLVMSFTIVFVGLMQTFTAVLQALGKPGIPVLNQLIGSGFKIVLTYILVPLPFFNVMGASIGSIVMYGVVTYLNYRYIKKMTDIKLDIKMGFLKPAFMSIVMGISVLVSFKILMIIIPSQNLATLLSVLAGVAVYGYQLLFMGGIRRHELEKSNMGRKLAKIIYKDKK